MIRKSASWPNLDTMFLKVFSLTMNGGQLQLPKLMMSGRSDVTKSESLHGCLFPRLIKGTSMKSELTVAPLPYIAYNEKVTSSLFAMF